MIVSAVANKSKQTLKDIKWVSDRVESSLHKDDLSFNHHKEVAKKPDTFKKRI